MKFLLSDILKQHFSQDPKIAFDEILGLTGKMYRKVKTRETLRFEISVKPGGNSLHETDLRPKKGFFIKKQLGIGWCEVFKNWSQFKWPAFSAANEYGAIRYLESIGIDAPSIAGFGLKGWNPAKLQSFLIMEALDHHKSLNDLAIEWSKLKDPLKIKRYLIERLAQIMKKMHEAGMNHRDCYLLHFLVDKNFGYDAANLSNDEPIYMIDLHRAQIRKTVPDRWKIKDLAGLYFSSKLIPLTSRDYLRFIKVYTGKSLREVLHKDFWKIIRKKGEKLYRTEKIY